jgi:hypothetical protein
MFAGRVRPILEQRCVVCHACNNAPCQLNLQSFEGLERGASKQRVYDSTRLKAMEPSRMFQDAQTTEEWRKERYGFFPVLSHSKQPADSMLHHFLQQRRGKPLGGDFEAEKNLVCAENVDAAKSLLESRPEAGMPFGLPPLDDDQFVAIEAWLTEGAPPPPPRGPSEATYAAIGRWEKFLNADDLRSQLVARYLYEHLFLAHLYFPDGAPRDFYRLVRSSTAGPLKPEPIVTARPFDDPKVARVHYRFVRVAESIVQKTHVPFRLDDAKLERYRQLFLEPKWTIDALPSYEGAVAGNPFVAFAAIPPRARYQFMLDDAAYHVRAFIHGPVCKGQAALNVIDEHFWIMFLAPGSDLSVTNPQYLKATAEDLKLPAEGGDAIDAVYERFKLSQLTYLKKRNAFYAKVGGRKLGDLWDGDGSNTGAVLTVYRHFDSASVSTGALGPVPKTAWVMDYPIFERVYYDLVAGFSVYGNIVHQLSTRRYMDNLRVESEDGFLRFMPRGQRAAIRASWYRGFGIDGYMSLINPLFENDVESQVAFRDPTQAKEELFTQVKAQLAPKVLGSARLPPPVLLSLANVASRYAQAFPDVTLLRVGDDVYSLVRDRAHLNVAFLFLEKQYLAPEEDRLQIVRGMIGSYPNMMLVVPPAELERFAAELRALRTDDDSWKKFLDAWGVRRGSKDFWSRFDWFSARALADAPVEGGILDLNRYSND